MKKQPTLFRFVLLCAWLLCSTAGYAQTVDKFITVPASQQTGKTLLQLIEKQAGIQCSYDEITGRRLNQKIKLPAGRTSVNDALEKIGAQAGLTHTIINNYIVFREAPPKKPGRLAGKIFDSENGQPIPGATIRVGATGTTSDVQGAFALPLPAGSYTALISYIGYGPKEVSDILVKEDGTFNLDIILKRAKGTLSEVVVRSSVKKESVAALYLRQRNAAGITDGVSAEQISRTPDKNIGETLKRISGLSTIDNKYVVARGLSERYNQAMLNGQAMPSTELNRKQFSFDIIPANMVANVVVAKTLTPDKSAEFGGGLVEVETKAIPTENFFSIAAGTTVNDLTAGKELMSFQRDGMKEYFGNYGSNRYIGGKKDWKTLNDIRAYQNAHAGQSIVENNWTPYFYKALPSQNYQVSLGRVITLDTVKQRRLGILASAGYRNTQSIQNIVSTRNGFAEGGEETALRGDQYGFFTSLGGMLGVGYTAGKHKISWQNVYTRLLEQQLIYGKGYHETLLEDTRSIAEKVQQTTLFQSQLLGEHALGNKGVKLNWLGSYTKVRRIRPDNHLIHWKEVPEDFGFKHNEFSIGGWTSSGGAGSASDMASLRLFSDATENNFSWDVNTTLPFRVSSTSHIFKAGYAGWVKDRRFYVAMVGDHGGQFEAYPSLGAFFSPEAGGGRTTVSQFGDDYNRNTPLHAVYGMFDNRIGKLRLVWGLRAEYFDMEKANQVIDATIANVTAGGSQLDDFSALRDAEKNWSLFPSANITYSLTPKINIRGAYSSSIIRPDLREMAYFNEYDFELGGIYQAEFLRSTRLKNYDLRLEWYPGAGEVISASVFYKNISLPMEIYKNLNIYTLRNNYSSINKGIELEARKSLSFIPVPVIKNLTLFGNFTYTDSRVTPMQVVINATNPANPHKLFYEMRLKPEEKRPLSGLSNYVTNAGMYYDDKHWHISASYNSISNRMVIYDDNITNWQFERPARSLDAQIAYRFFKEKAEIKLNLSNLLNESSIIYTNNGTADEINKARKGDYGNHFLLYDKKKDILVQRLTPGRTLGLSIVYNIQ